MSPPNESPDGNTNGKGKANPEGQARSPASGAGNGAEEAGDESDQLEPVDYTRVVAQGTDLTMSALIDEDGRIDINVNYIAEPAPSFLSVEDEVDPPEYTAGTTTASAVPALEIVIFVVGSRGDVQPFLPLGLRLKRDGHRVRLATHDMFSNFVLDAGLEFFPIGGDPADLMSYMVKNPGLIPGVESIRKGDISKKRTMIGEILDGCWRACHEPDPISNMAFSADAIVANPPSFAHIHCAEALAIPLHIVFTMPWISTRAFPHPLVNISQTNASPGATNYLSYAVVDLLSWQGLGSVINDFRETALSLPPLSSSTGPLVLERLRTPTSFCWSPALIPKPADWKAHVSVTGFMFHPAPDTFTPDADLSAFFESGDAPVYIGFGSVPVPDPSAFVSLILKAIAASGVRALLSVGWANLGADLKDSIPPNVFLLGNVPHDWLFPKCVAVVHHGGAGTTAIGIRLGKPTLVVPFFGDQPFWGKMVAQAGAGPPPIPHKELTTENLTSALKVLVQADTQLAAEKLGKKIRDEDGVESTAQAFYRHLPVANMRCDLDPSKVAAFWCQAEMCKLSPFAAQTLVDAKEIDPNLIRPHCLKTYGAGAAGDVAIGRLSIVRSVLTGSGLSNVDASRARNRKQIGLGRSNRGLIGLATGFSTVVSHSIKGAKDDGASGFFKGAGAGVVKAVQRPTGGRRMGLITSVIKSFTTPTPHVWKHAEVKENQGVAEVAASTEHQRRVVIDAWRKRVMERRMGRVTL